MTKLKHYEVSKKGMDKEKFQKIIDDLKSYGRGKSTKEALRKLLKEGKIELDFKKLSKSFKEAIKSGIKHPISTLKEEAKGFKENKKGGSVKASKYSIGGGVRKSKYSL